MPDTNQVRINELAHELEVKAKTIIDLLPGYGVTEKKTHSSSIPVEVAQKVRLNILAKAEAKAVTEAAANSEEEAKQATARAARKRPADQQSIYISYASQDQPWHLRITTHLQNAGFAILDHPPTALEKAKVFVLLVSSHYLDSNEILKFELPKIRSLLDSQRARVIYVILEQCPWRASLASPFIPSVAIPREDRVLSQQNEEQLKDDLHSLAQEVRRAIQETDKTVAPTPKQRTSSELPTKGQRHRELDSVNTQLRSKESAPLADAPQYARDRVPPPMQSPQVQPPLAQLLAAKLEISSQSGEYRTMATLISPTVAVTPFHVISESGLLKDPSPKIIIQCLGMSSPPIPATVAAFDEDVDFAVLRLASSVPFDLPSNLIHTTFLLPKTNWLSYFMPPYRGEPTQGGPRFVVGRFGGNVELGGKQYIELAVSAKAPVPGISGAPVIAGDRLVGIIATADESWQFLYAVSMMDMAESKKTDVIRSLVPNPPVPVPDKLDASLSPEPSQPSSWIDQKTLDRFSPSARTTLARANQLRNEYKRRRIHTEHLLIALSEQPQSQLPDLLAEFKLDLLSILAPELGSSDIPEPADRPSEIEGLPPVSANVRRALITGRERANADNCETILAAHILFGVLSTTENASVRTLNSKYVVPDRIKLPTRLAADSEAESLLAGFQSDDPSGPDLLDITKEVEALASVLAARDVDPPLSLGLFGDWGTGKSFFMKQLEARIRELQNDANMANGASAYCRSIVQITFNAWNYIDCNLWASLTAEIFECLAAAIAQTRGEDSPEQRALVLAAASSSQSVLAEAEKKRAEAEQELKQTEERLAALQKNEADFDASLEPGEILRQALRFAMQDEHVQKSLDAAARAMHIPEAEAAANEVRSEIIELQGTGNALILTLKNTRYLWVWFVVLGFALGAGWLIPQFVSESHITVLATRLVAILTTLSIFVAPLVKASRKAMDLVENARASKQALVEQKRKEQTDKLKVERGRIRQKVETARKDVEKASEKAKALNEQLEKMRADRQMADYIRQRHQSTDYTQHLGIISRVRADLRHLSTLLRAVKEESERDASEAEMKERQAEKDRERKSKGKEPLFPRIDRIVLYIDDLDRCPEKNVVEVLQAVHLLLAFPLFVVVVGVDPRWLLHSLQQYSRAFQSVEIENGTEKTSEEEGHWGSTPLNYLEKIFQIPFSLRPINKIGFSRLVDRFARSLEKPQAPAEPHSAATELDTIPLPPNASGWVEVPGSDILIKPLMVAPSFTPHPQESAAEQPAPPLPPPLPEPTAALSSIDRHPEHLQFREWEQSFMKELHEFIPTPRAAKRFINIYRLLRASLEESERAAFIGGEKSGMYRAAMLLLAILTGYPDQATEILGALIVEEPRGTWWEFVATLKTRILSNAGPAPEGKSSQLSKRSAPPSTSASRATAGQTSEAQGRDTRSWVDLFDKLERLKESMRDRSCQSFSEWAPRVARYSFQSGRVLLSLQK